MVCWVGGEKRKKALDLGADYLLEEPRGGLGHLLPGLEACLHWPFAWAGWWACLPLVPTFPALSHPPQADELLLESTRLPLAVTFGQKEAG